jgi:hypothetical protein
LSNRTLQRFRWNVRLDCRCFVPGQPGLDQAPAAADLAERRLPLRQPLPRSQDKGVRMAARCWCRTSKSRDRDGASESRGRRLWWCLSRDLRASASCANSKAAPPILQLWCISSQRYADSGFAITLLDSPLGPLIAPTTGPFELGLGSRLELGSGASIKSGNSKNLSSSSGISTRPASH